MPRTNRNDYGRIGYGDAPKTLVFVGLLGIASIAAVGIEQFAIRLLLLGALALQTAGL